MRVDVLVIGSGISGAGAGLAAARHNKSVAIVRRGFGATTLASGIVGLDLPSNLPGGSPSDDVKKLLCQTLPFHPFEKRKQFLNVLGRVVSGDIAFSTLAAGALDGLQEKKLAIVSFIGLTEVRPEPIAGAAQRLGLDAHAVKIPFPEAAHRNNLTTPELARMCDDWTPAEKLVESLKTIANDYDCIALPPVAGLLAWQNIKELFDEHLTKNLGTPWFELVAALPSVPGMRIQQSLDARFKEAGIEVVHGPIQAWACKDSILHSVKAGQAEGTQVIEAQQFVLATGGLVGRGIQARDSHISEALFGLSITSKNSDGKGQEEQNGVLFDSQLRPLNDSGTPLFSNMRVAGELMGYTFGNGQGNLGVSLATGWAAGERAAQTVSEFEEFKPQPQSWQNVETEGDPLGCINCGLCLARCPTLRALSREKLTYPGPRSLMAGLVRFESELDEIADELSLCTLCGACSVVCSACVPVPENVTRARQIIGRLSPEAGPSAYQALRKAFDKPKKLFEAEPIEGPYLDKAESVLFVGCSLPYYERDHGEDTIRLLKALKVDFTLINEVCCGGPLEVIGAQGAQAMAEHNINEIRRVGAKRIISCCPRCAETMSTSEAYREFEIEHTTTLLARLLPGTKLADELRKQLENHKVTFHDPCERARLAGEVKAAREVIKAVGLDLVEMPRSGVFTECCGAGGGVRAAQTRASVRIARMRVSDALKTGASILLTECPSCLHNLYNGRKRKQKLEISNLSSYLGRQLDS